MDYFFNTTKKDESKSEKKEKENNYKYSFKVSLLGNSGTGKTSLIYHYVLNKKNVVPVSQYTQPLTVPTIGIEFACKYYTIEDIPIRLFICDTAGQERFRSIIRSYYRDAFCFILVYDVTNRESFIAINHWIKELRDNLPLNDHENIHDRYLIMLVGSKTDLTLKPNARKVSVEEGKYMARSYGIEYFFETNALGQFIQYDNISAVNIFDELANLIIKNLDKYISVNANIKTNIENQLSISNDILNDEYNLDDDNDKTLCCKYL